MAAAKGQGPAADRALAGQGTAGEVHSGVGGQPAAGDVEDVAAGGHQPVDRALAGPIAAGRGQRAVDRAAGEPIVPLPVSVALPPISPLPAKVAAVPTATLPLASEPLTARVPPLTLVGPV